MLTKGNQKLGKTIHSWSIPAIKTCPGASETCAALCYATKGHYQWRTVQQSQNKNLVVAKRKTFVERMSEDIAKNKAQKIRIHAAGDFFDLDYINDWIQIVRAHPQTLFYAYTRSWRVPELLEPLIEFSKEPNVYLWFSCDNATGRPPRVKGIRRAYMAISDEDAQNTPYKCDLVFRDNTKTVMKKASDALVCPVENGVEGKHHHTCDSCKFCFTEPVQINLNRGTDVRKNAGKDPDRRVIATRLHRQLVSANR